MKKRIFYSILGLSTLFILTIVSLYSNILYINISSNKMYESATEVFVDNIIIWASLGVFFVYIARLLSKNITNSIISQIDRNNPKIYEELEPFFRALDTKEWYIQKQKNDLEQKINEFDTISSSIGDGLIMIDQDQKILTVNKKASRTFGKEDTNYEGKPFIELMRFTEVTTAISKACNGEFVEEIVNYNNKFYVFKFSPVYSNKTIKGVILLIIDNTKKIEAENLRREFSANVSHELRTPLTSISGYAELIKSGLVETKDVRPFAENIYNESQVLVTLIDDIIKISKLDENQLDHAKESIDLGDLITEILQRLDVQIKNKKIDIKTNFEDISILGVKPILRESFYNLIQNGIKYNKENGTLEISITKEQSRVLIEITDTGIGINNVSIDRIFERFYREDTSHSKAIEGTGLGLAIAKKGITQHNGYIKVKSEVNKGTTFKIYINDDE